MEEWRYRNVYKVFIQKSEERRPLGRQKSLVHGVALVGMIIYLHAL
jgi:hypothetical protein